MNELTENQELFLQIVEDFDPWIEVDFNYSGRGMFGRTCPAIRVGDWYSVEELKKLCNSDEHEMFEYDDEEEKIVVDIEVDNMGLGYVVYARR